MDIINVYKIKIDNVPHFVYMGTCDGIPKKWITKSEWDGIVKFEMVDKKLKFTDVNGQEIIIFDETDVEYQYY